MSIDSSVVEDSIADRKVPSSTLGAPCAKIVMNSTDDLNILSVAFFNDNVRSQRTAPANQKDTKGKS